MSCTYQVSLGMFGSNAEGYTTGHVTAQYIQSLYPEIIGVKVI